MMQDLSILYSFRRCPYAMRARLGLVFAETPVILREIVFWNKPAHMLAISPKGTVPVLQLASAEVIDESIDIVSWALEQQDPHGLLNGDLVQADLLIQRNDREFKYWLDRYKYADRYPEQSQLDYRQQGEQFLHTLEGLLMQQTYLLGSKISKADIAVMPFVRQFAHVNQAVFERLPYPHVQKWLSQWLAHPKFLQVMKKYQPWQEGDEPVYLHHH